MNILQVNDVDLPGRIFNGYNLAISLNEGGHNACQIVKSKYGFDKVSKLISENINAFTEETNRNLEDFFSANNIFCAGAKHLKEHPDFLTADIVHYHLVHNRLISFIDYPELTRLKPSVWTVHDPWIVTGHCIHPLDCKGWMEGCLTCDRLTEHFSLRLDTAHQMWKVKQQVYSSMNIDLVVASKFMEDYIKNSPFSEFFPRIHRIPFGVDVKEYEAYDKASALHDLQIPDSNFVIGFRNEFTELKGCKYVYEMLEQIPATPGITIITLGHAKLPSHIKDKFHTLELGWQDDDHMIKKFYASCSVFLMPSLAESFGLMSIEAMASGVPVVVFENTVLPEITFAPNCGIAVPYKSSEGMKSVVERLMQNPDEVIKRGNIGREIVKEYYKYSDYVKKHVDLYEAVNDKKAKNIFCRSNKENNRIVKEQNMSTELPENIGNLIKNFEVFMKSLTGGTLKRVVIFGAGNYGKRLYHDLKSRLIYVEYFADNNENLWGQRIEGCLCISPKELMSIKKSVIVLVASRIPEPIVQQLKQEGLPYVFTKQDLESELSKTPPIKWVDVFEYTDGQSEQVQLLTQRLERTIYDMVKNYTMR